VETWANLPVVTERVASPVFRADLYEPLRVKVEIIPISTDPGSVAAAEPGTPEQAIVVLAHSGEQALREADAVEASAL
jgi:exosome complex RNA-binding protein Rrp42 (RNase PH superfamily)